MALSSSQQALQTTVTLEFTFAVNIPGCLQGLSDSLACYTTHDYRREDKPCKGLCMSELGEGLELRVMETFELIL